MSLKLRKQSADVVRTPSALYVQVFIDQNGQLALKDADGNVTLPGGSVGSGGVDSLQVSGAEAEDGDTLDPGWVYPVPGPGAESSITLHIGDLDVEEIQNKRVAIKYVGPGGRIYVSAPAGQLIQGDDGQLVSLAAVDAQTTGEYREWQADESGNWLMVSKVVGIDMSGHAGSHQSGGFDEIDVTGLHGLLADPQTPRTHTHANATTSTAGFLASTDKAKLDALSTGQSATVGTLTADAYHETPAQPTYAAALTLDTAVKNDFEVGVLTGNTVITLSNPARGRQGYVAVKQDATGGRTVTIQATGYTTRRESGSSDLVAASGANAETIYAYLMYALGGTNCLMLTKLSPV